MGLAGKGDLDTCQKCKSNDLSYTEWSTDGGIATCDVNCDDCEFKAYVSYKATGWNEIE